MKCISKMSLLAVLALAVVLCAGVAIAQEQELEETPYDDVEYGAYETATKEPDLEKRGTLLLQFVEKYPKSALMPHIKAAYDAMMQECSAAKNYELLEVQAENWLRLHPGDLRTLAVLADATDNLKKWDRCVECMEEIYTTQPAPSLARRIFALHGMTKNLAKQIEWADKLFKMPEFDADFMLRWDFVTKYTASDNIPKAAEYARLTIKSADLVKDPDEKTAEQLRHVRRACNHVIGMDYMEKNNFAEAVKAFQEALKAERYGEGYYYIAQSQERMELVDDAIVSYAKAEVVGGESPELAAKAKARLEQLYKALHNNTTIGIDKVYRKAKEELG